VQSCYSNLNFSIQGRELPAPGHEPAAEHRLISPDYFRVMGIPLIAGRYFRPEDRAGAQRVALINQRVAERYFPGENLVGRQIAYGTKPKPGTWMTIVGIVGNVKDAGRYRPGLNVLFAPFGQFDGPWKTVSLVLRATVEPETLNEALSRFVIGMSPLHVATCAGAAALVLAVALAASLVAARRAPRADPLAALRHE